MKYLETCLHWLKAQSKQRQLSIFIGLILIAGVGILLTYWTITPPYGVLFNHLDSRDANQILNHLEQANIAYKVRNQGSEILIAQPLIDKTRIKLMNSEMQFAQRVGFELFDKSDFGMTDFSQKINYQRALQGELERTISSLDEVQQARVHLSIPEHHLFQQEENQPKAAVSLYLNRPLTSQQVASIQQLITASVAHMQKNNVIIVDQNGNSLTNDEDNSTVGHFAIKKNIEHYLNQKVTQMLNAVFADEEVMVKIDVTLNYDELRRELIKPQHDGIVTHEKETQHSTSSKSDKAHTNRDLTREKSYQFGSEKEHFTRASGNIERLSVSVAIPQFTSQQTIEQIKRLVKSIVGFDEARGDKISIEALITKPTSIPSLPLTSSATQNNAPLNLIFSAIFGCLVLAVFFYSLTVKSRRRQRQFLLTELTQWLNKYE
ncbi:flagellar basal-body MS-ring/collar protein FliF [Legionella micdadei]|uniref:Flagellar M-ring protein n=1 Tax=Legionella micdadei TaxID=451 RepID=A0A098GI06_LEGMI|nr:flagellar basal-body MS-ring/collar protein FliF [Legionella micdadei]ARG96963.1 flagellar M-ring protein FliF [Legionella micdadei]KTD26673.1 flagellar MS-ring protein [Legionella micdadei]NSL19478.1 flagellar M-ring protein FliF [Legionella micdadei]CEG61630.1 Truncated flagellar M-ring protein FliF [Legionella micdadei]SCY47619.1 flagellar M-ring protein FliF [Legionella micdadei]